MTRRKPLAALAAITAAVAVAVPTASASAATTASLAPYTPPAEVCATLGNESAAGSMAGGNLLLVSTLLSQTAADIGCGGAAV
jgi:hypothetical protein